MHYNWNSSESSVKIGTIQRRLAWPLRKDDTQKSRMYHFFCTPNPLEPKAKTYITCDSHVVPHRSTEQAQGCLTSEFGWDPVLSPWYERMMGDHWTDPPPTGVPEPHKRPRTSEYTKARILIHSHTFSAFWLRSSVVSVLISLISGTRTKCPPDD